MGNNYERSEEKFNIVGQILSDFSVTSFNRFETRLFWQINEKPPVRR